MWIPATRKFFPDAVRFARRLVAIGLASLLLPASFNSALAWTFSDLNPMKHIRECKIFSLTRANPVGVRIMIVPVIDDPINAPIYTRLGGEFANSLRSFANEVWLVTDLPNNAIKSGFYTGLPNILADYRMRNYLSMDLLHDMIPDFECDYIALFEVTDYDRYWIDQDLQHRVGVRAVFYDYDDGEPRLEKYSEGGRGRRLEEGAFSEAERIAIKVLVQNLERPLRESIAAREAELAERYNQTKVFAELTTTREMAVHKFDLGIMQGQVDRSTADALTALERANQVQQERDYWQKKAAEHEAKITDLENQIKEAPSAPGKGEKGGPTQIMPRTGVSPQTPWGPGQKVAPPSTPSWCVPQSALPPAPSTVVPPRLDKVSSSEGFYEWNPTPLEQDSPGWEYVDPEPVPSDLRSQTVRRANDYQVIRVP